MMNSVFRLFKKFFFSFVSRIYFSGYRVPRLTITLFLLHFKDAVPFTSGFHYFWEGFYFSLITLLEVIFSSGRIKKSLSFWLFDVLSVVFLQVIASLNLWFDILHHLGEYSLHHVLVVAPSFSFGTTVTVCKTSTMSLCFSIVSVFVKFCASVYICSCESSFISLSLCYI